MSAETDIVELGFADWLPDQTAFSDAAQGNCGARLYPQVNTTPGEATFPYAVYRRVSTDGTGTLTADSKEPTAQIGLTIWGGKGPGGYRVAKRSAYWISRFIAGWATTSSTKKWGQVVIKRVKVADDADVLESNEGAAPDQLAQGVSLILTVTWEREALTIPRA